MTEAMWIELIRLLPTLIWIGFAFAALVVARRLLARESHRMTRVETPFVSVELAREVIEQAANRREEPGALPAGAPYRPRPGRPVEPPEDGPRGAPGYGPPPTAPVSPPAPVGDRPGEHDDGSAEAEDADDAPPGGETPPPPMYPPIPPQRRFPTPGTPYRPAADPPEAHQTAPLVPPYQFRPPPDPVDPQRGLRAATRLSLSTDLLQGGAILWVDDHPEWNESLVRLFRTAGITVDTVDSTDAALHAMSIAPYDLVITDMRREDEPAGETAGMALLDRMVAAGIPTPAVFFSGPADAFAALHPRAAVATNSPEELVNCVIDIVGHRRRHGEARPLRLPWRQR
ncbi:MAG TPA: response regulator [Glycomyces sp.]|nr:response regulator [Glycomyces sp.]